MPPISVMIKPASSSCNLLCQYCFYHDEVSKREIKQFCFMNNETIEAIIKNTLAHASKSCSFSFQGGEPTLAGIGFFKKVVEFQKKHNNKNIIINNALQTNGTLIDNEWASFLAKNRFLVGVSLDGYESIHDMYRKDKKGEGTFVRVMQGIKALNSNKVDFNILTVVTAQTAKHIKDVYAFFMKHGFVYQQYIACLDPIGEKQGKHRYSLTPRLYARFLKNLFDLWFRDREQGKFVYNRYFENIAAILLRQRAESCDMNGICSVQYAFEGDGSVYPCDFYMFDKYHMGNINSDSLTTIDENRKRTRFIEQSAILPKQCINCQWLSICRGGCRRNRVQTDKSNSGINYFCEANKEFFPYMLPRMIELTKH